ncbi:MAG: hypothetical protein OXH52_07125 [Gammaproteobacteria bacterium]|nr:hypothetical protein [Gammaproteobacteria bacterium]
MSEQRKSLPRSGSLEQPQLEPRQRQLRGIRVDQVHVADARHAAQQRRRASARSDHRHPGVRTGESDHFQVEERILSNLGERDGQATRCLKP